MSVSRWNRSTITPPSTAPISCANRSRTNRANKSQQRPETTEPKNETGRCLHRRPGGGDLGACLRGEPHRAQRIFAGTDDDAALFHRRLAVPVRGAAEGFMARAGLDQLHAVPRPVSLPGL